MNPLLKDKAARAIRDGLMGKPSTDRNWEGARKFWLADFEQIQAALERAGFQITPIPNTQHD